jgi:hypothetical protein
MAAGAFLHVVGRTAGLEEAAVRRLERDNGSNVEALYRALLAACLQERGRPPERIAVLCRRADSQLSEVDHLVKRFGELGTETHRVYPDEASGDELFTAHGKTFDFVYRHLFVHRLSETPSPFLEAFFAGQATRGSLLLNRPAAHVEAKSNFALLSRALEEPGLASAAGLGPDALEAIRRAVPWTRALARVRSAAPGRGGGRPGGPRRRAPASFVLKRPGTMAGRRSSSVRPPRSPASRPAPSWPSASDCPGRSWSGAQRATPGGGFVVQSVVDIPRERHLFATPGGPAEAEVFVDYSAFASVGVDPEPPWGGVVRASASRIVNIQGGGGVLPLLEETVWARLRSALRAES